MRNKLFLLSIFTLTYFTLSAQNNRSVNDAFLITRMAEKFHVQPKPVDDTFSAKVYTKILKQLDGDKIFFTSKDIEGLSKYKYELDDEIKNRNGDFLKAITKIFGDRVAKADTMISNICKTPFNFSLPEKITATEIQSYPADEKALRLKMYKFIKASVLDDIMDDDDILDISPQKIKKYVDSLEPLSRLTVQKEYLHPVKLMLQTVGGIQQAVGDEYCKAIAVCYDPHTEYFPQQEKENFESQLGQKSMAFGFKFKQEEDGSIKIDKVAAGSPAFKSGQINKGDKIESVQWKDQQPINVAGDDAKQLVDVLEMSNHEKATFKIKKPDGTERSVVLYKEKLEDEDNDNKVKSFLLKGSKTVGFLSLPSFYEDWENEEQGISGCANDVAKEILKLKKENIGGLILDLRSNGGGSVKEAVELAGLFIDAGPVAQFKEKTGKIITLKDVNRGTIYDGPLMILVNGHSASASEIVAGILQDYNRAIIVGSPTYGKATAQVVLPMDTTIDMEKDISKIQTASYLKTTVSQLYRVTGNTAQAKGVAPDILLPDLLQAHPQREADEPNALISSTIESSKYFKPYAPMALANLQSAANAQTNASPYFKYLKNYIDAEKSYHEIKDISLKFSDAMEQKRKEENAVDSNEIKKEKASYTVQANSFETQQMQLDERLKDMNDQWKEYLTEDPHLHIAYDVMLLMIK